MVLKSPGNNAVGSVSLNFKSVLPGRTKLWSESLRSLTPSHPRVLPWFSCPCQHVLQRVHRSWPRAPICPWKSILSNYITLIRVGWIDGFVLLVWIYWAHWPGDDMPAVYDWPRSNWIIAVEVSHALTYAHKTAEIKKSKLKREPQSVEKRTSE